MKKQFLLALCLTIGIGSAKSQVTIGSDTPPSKGALLDLKDGGTYTDGETAVKGLGLPRVELKSLKLDATYDDLAKTIAGNYSTATWDKAAHTGLIVYNVKEKPAKCENGKLQSPIGEGLHVWDGGEWQRIPRLESGGDVRTVSYPAANKMKMEYIVDGVSKESEEYYIADFGTAGTWMTQNLRTKYSPDGTALAMTGNQNSNGLDSSGKPQKVAGYPSNSDPSNPSDYNANVAVGNQIGLLYDWYTATDHLNCSVSDQRQGKNFSESGAPGANEVEKVETKGYVKGICPTGWHMPSDREYNMLELELTKNASQYTQTPTTNGGWTDGWETTSGWRGTINGTVMKSTTKIENSSYNLPNVDSKTSVNGGFDFYLAGYAGTGSADRYGYYGYLWSASSYSSSNAWYRSFISVNSLGDRNGSDRSFLLSVRCKKD